MMSRASSRKAMLFAGIAACMIGMVLFAPPMMNDFVEYWAAGRLTLAGQNPYDAALILDVERSAGYTMDRPLLMLNPPSVLTLAIPLSLLPYQQASALWLVLNTIILLLCCTILWDLAGGSRRRRWVAYLCGVVFVPSLLALLLGQISLLLLLGITLFLKFEREDRLVAAGLASTLLLIKPHVVYLVGAVMLAWWLRTRDWRYLLGVALGGVGFLFPLLFNPDVYEQYVQMVRTESLIHFSPSTLGTLLRIATGDPSRFGLQFLPMILGLAYLATRFRRYRTREWDWEREMPLLVVVSVATAAYGWLFDQVVLLVAALPMFAAGIRAGGSELAMVVVFWTITGAILFVQAVIGVNALWHFWLPYAYLVAIILFVSELKPGSETAGKMTAGRG